MPSKDTQFKPGNKLAKGGARVGGGRPANWLKQACEDAMVKKDIVSIRTKIAAGEPITLTYKVGRKSVTVTRTPSLDDMQRAADWLADRAAGKATTTIDHTGLPAPISIGQLISQAESERGLK